MEGAGTKPVLPSPLSLGRILAMPVADLRTELSNRGLPSEGLPKLDLQLSLIEATAPRLPSEQATAADAGRVTPTRGQEILNPSGSPSHGEVGTQELVMTEPHAFVVPPEVQIKLQELTLQAEERKFRWKLEHELAKLRLEADRTAQAEAAERASQIELAKLQKEKEDMERHAEEAERQ